jgi:hypothetical protein
LVKVSAAFKNKRMFSLTGRWVSANGEISPLQFLQPPRYFFHTRGGALPSVPVMAASLPPVAQHWKRGSEAAITGNQG